MDLIENTEDLEPSIFTGWQIGLQDIVEYLGEELSQTERETLLGRKWTETSKGRLVCFVCFVGAVHLWRHGTPQQFCGHIRCLSTDIYFVTLCQASISSS